MRKFLAAALICLLPAGGLLAETAQVAIPKALALPWVERPHEFRVAVETKTEGAVIRVKYYPPGTASTAMADPTETDPALTPIREGTPNRGFLFVDKGGFYLLKAFKTGLLPSPTLSVFFPLLGPLSPPVLFLSQPRPPQKVTVISTEPGASIAYTLDGSDPTPALGFRLVPVNSDERVRKEIAVEGGQTVRAIAFREGFQSSRERTLKIKPAALPPAEEKERVPPPEISFASQGGGYLATIASNTVGASILYTLNGNEPRAGQAGTIQILPVDANSRPAAFVPVTPPVTVIAKAEKTGFKESITVSRSLIVPPPQSLPILLFAGRTTAAAGETAWVEISSKENPGFNGNLKSLEFLLKTSGNPAALSLAEDKTNKEMLLSESVVPIGSEVTVSTVSSGVFKVAIAAPSASFRANGKIISLPLLVPATVFSGSYNLEIAEVHAVDTNGFTLSAETAAGQLIVFPRSFPKKGDVDLDNRITINDAVLALRIITGVIAPSPEQIEAGDMDGNRRITVPEVILILEAVIGHKQL